MGTHTVVQRRPGTASDRLHRKIELVGQPFVDASKRFVTHPRVRDLYPEYLVALHWVVRATVPLMRAALERARATADIDPVAGGLVPYLERHIAEEQGHDEWLLQDLERLGLSRQAVLSRMPTATVAALAGRQYYWVLHHHPVALVGYLAVSEGYPIAPHLVRHLMRETGYPPECFSMLLEHAELDPGHREELDGLIDDLPLRPDHEALLGLSAMSTVDAMAACIAEIAEGGS